MKSFDSQPNTIPALFLNSAGKFPEKPAILYKNSHHFGEVPYKRLKNLVGNFVLSFQKMGLKRGDRVVIISENRPEWIVSDLAIQFIGAVVVPIHKILNSVQIKEVVKEIEPAFIIVSDKEALDKIIEIEAVLTKKVPIIYFEEAILQDKIVVEKFKGHHFTQTLKSIGHYHTKTELEELAVQIKPQDVASIIFTSGSTGKFKGVELTHANFVSNAVGVTKLEEIFSEDRFLSVLPLSHVFERTAGYYLPLYVGASISYIEDVAKISDYAQDFKPTIIVAVPRLYEKIYEKVWDKVSKKKLEKTIFELAIYFGKKKGNKNIFLYKLYDKLVYKKIRDNFGGKIRFFVSGGASLAAWLGEFFDAVGVPVLEGYGLTETAPVVSCNNLRLNKFGTVGSALPGNEIKIAGDGEILVKGPGVMKGYYKNKEETAKVFVGGWFKTGDLGKIDNDGYLTITGRKKDLIVLTTGKKVLPVAIEEALTASFLIDQVMVLGDGYKHISAIIVPSEYAIKNAGEKIISVLEEEIKKRLGGFSKIEQVNKFIIATEGFTVENGLLTITLKIRRPQIIEKYASQIKDLYNIKVKNN